MGPQPDPTSPDPRASNQLIRQTFLEVARAKRFGWVETAEEDGWEWVIKRPDSRYSVFVGLRRKRDGYQTKCRHIDVDSVAALQEGASWRALLLNDDLRALHQRENHAAHYDELGTPNPGVHCTTDGNRF